MELFDVLADSTRRQILDLLRIRSRTVNELTDLLQISQPGVSKHLRVLREAQLVTVRQEAQQRWYELRPEPLAVIEAWLAPYRQMWEGRYDRLDDVLDELKQEKGDQNGQD